MIRKTIVPNNGLKTFLSTSCRCIQSQVETKPPPVNDPQLINLEEKKLLVNDVKLKLSSFSGREKFLNENLSKIKIPSSAFKVKTNHYEIRYSYTIDDVIAKKVVDCIQPYILQDNSVIVEINPGVGLITSHLLEAGVQELHICQKKTRLLPNFENLVSCYHPRICLNLGKVFPRIMYEKHPSIAYINYMHKLITEKKKNESEENPKLKVISVEHKPSFFPQVCRNILYGQWFYYDDVEFYSIVKEKTVRDFLGKDLRNQQKYCIHACFHLLMNCEKLCELPRISFLPWTKTDQGEMYLLRIYKKQNAFNIIKKEELMDFYRFLQIIGTSKYNYIIPTLEHWSPGCGVYLIKGGIPIWKRVVDLSCEEAAHLYKLFQTTPEFENYKEVLYGSVLEVADEIVEENEGKITDQL